MTVLEPRRFDDSERAEISCERLDGAVIVRLTSGGTTDEVAISFDADDAPLAEPDVAGVGFGGRSFRSGREE